MPNHAKSPVKWIVDPKTGCWIWQRCTTGSGYGTIRVKGKLLTATKYVYELFVGPVEAGLVLDHVKGRCTNTLCVNPDHLEPVSYGENLRRGKTGKLTKAQVEEIQKSVGQTKSQAEKYGVTQGYVRQIQVGRRGGKL